MSRLIDGPLRSRLDELVHEIGADAGPELRVDGLNGLAECVVVRLADLHALVFAELARLARLLDDQLATKWGRSPCRPGGSRPGASDRASQAWTCWPSIWTHCRLDWSARPVSSPRRAWRRQRL